MRAAAFRQPRFFLCVLATDFVLSWRCITIATNGKKELEINEAIRDREVRVIAEDGSQLGVLNTREALRMAEEKNLDLVKIAPQAQPPVCKFLDYGKYRFEQQKREKEAKKNQKVIDVKEIRLYLFPVLIFAKTAYSSRPGTSSRCRSASAAARWRTPIWAWKCTSGLLRLCPAPWWTNSPSWRAAACSCS